MRQKVSDLWFIGICLCITALLMAACATSPLGKGVQTGEVNRLFVDSAMDEVVRMYCVDGKVYANCTPRISKQSYDTALSAYVKAEIAQRAYADALILWDRTKTAPADQKVQTALADMKTQFTNVANLLCTFKTSSAVLAQACATVGR